MTKGREEEAASHYAFASELGFPRLCLTWGFCRKKYFARLGSGGLCALIAASFFWLLQMDGCDNLLCKAIGACGTQLLEYLPVSTSQ